MTRLWYIFWTILAIAIFIIVAFFLPHIENFIFGEPEGRDQARTMGAFAAMASIKYALRFGIALLMTIVTFFRLRNADISRFWIFVFFPVLFSGLFMFLLPAKSIGNGFWAALTAGNVSPSWAFFASAVFVIYLTLLKPRPYLTATPTTPHRAVPVTAGVSGLGLAILYWPLALAPFGAIPVIGPVISAASQFMNTYLRLPLSAVERVIGIDPAAILTVLLAVCFCLTAIARKRRVRDSEESFMS